MSLSADSAFRIDRGPVTNFQLEPSELYEYPAQDSVTALKTCALNSEIRTVDAPLSAGDQFSFTMQMNPQQFLSNDIKLFFTLPFTVTLREPKGDTDPVISEANFMDVVFAHNADIVYSQHSIIQALQTLTVGFNNQEVSQVNNLAETFNITSPYYAKADVAEWLHASQPDRYQNFQKYTAGTDTASRTVTYLNEMGDKAVSTISAVNDSNIFSSTMQNSYVPRTPEWSWVGPIEGAPKTGCRVKCTFFTYIPLSMFGTPDLPTAFPGVKELTVTASLKPSAAQYIFNVKDTALAVPDATNYPSGAAPRYSSIVVANDSKALSTAKMVARVFTQPQFMRAAGIDKATGLLKPYAVDYPRVNTTPCESYPRVKPFETKDFNRSGITTNSVPASIYVAIVKKKPNDFRGAVATPVNFGLIRNLVIKVDSAASNFSNMMSLGSLADSNGYDELDPIGRMIKGYPIKIDVSKDLTLPGDTVVGAVGNFSLSVEGSFTNQGDADADYQLIVVTVSAGRLVYDGANFTSVTGAMINSSALSETNFLTDQYSNVTRRARVLGGGFLSNAGNFIKRAALGAWNNREQIAKAIGDANKLRSLVMGGQGRLQGSNVAGAGTHTPTMGAGDVKRSVFK